MKDELREAFNQGRKQQQTDTEEFKTAIKLNLVEALEHGYVFMSICAIAWPDVSRALIQDWLEENNCTGKWEEVGRVPYLNVIYKGYQS